eukprot:14301217-Alexandrium_andersonii.AAC.1
MGCDVAEIGPGAGSVGVGRGPGTDVDGLAFEAEDARSARSAARGVALQHRREQHLVRPSPWAQRRGS